MVFLFSDLILTAFPRSGAVLMKSATIGNSLKNVNAMANAGSSGVLYDFGGIIHLNEHSRFVDVADTDGKSRVFVPFVSYSLFLQSDRTRLVSSSATPKERQSSSSLSVPIQWRNAPGQQRSRRSSTRT